jgi:hypothetical protein
MLNLFGIYAGCRAVREFRFWCVFNILPQLSDLKESSLSVAGRLPIFTFPLWI